MLTDFYVKLKRGDSKTKLYLLSSKKSLKIVAKLLNSLSVIVLRIINLKLIFFESLDLDICVELWPTGGEGADESEWQRRRYTLMQSRIDLIKVAFSEHF